MRTSFVIEFRLIIWFFLMTLFSVLAPSLKADQTNRFMESFTFPDERIHSTNEIERASDLKGSITALEKIYEDRFNKGLAYHPTALSNLRILIDLSKKMEVQNRKSANWRGIRAFFKKFGRSNISLNDLINSQESFLQAVDFIDLFSAILMEREEVYQKEAMAFSKLHNLPVAPSLQPNAPPLIQGK